MDKYIAEYKMMKIFIKKGKEYLVLNK